MRLYTKKDLLNKTFDSLNIDFRVPTWNPKYSDWSKLGNKQSWNEIASTVLESVPEQIKTYPFKGRIDESSHSS